MEKARYKFLINIISIIIIIIIIIIIKECRVCMAPVFVGCYAGYSNFYV